MAGQLVTQVSAQIAAGDNALPLANEPIERPPFDAYVNVAINGSAAGLRAGVNIGGVNVFDDFQINAVNRFALVPDDLIVVNGLCPTGMQNRVRISNPTAGALTHFTYVQGGVFARNW